MDYKALSAEFIDDLLAAERFHTKPLHHQGVSIAWALDRDDKRVAYWHDIGSGKSLTSVYTHKAWGTRRLLIACPNSVVEGWARQLQTHLPGQTYVLLRGTGEQRRHLVFDERHPRMTFVTNYEGLRTLFAAKVTSRGKTKTVVSSERVRAAAFDGIILDECHCLTDSQTIQSRCCAALSEAAESVIIMTGTAYKRGLEDLWGQYLALDGGRTLGASRRWFIDKWFNCDFFGRPTIKGQAAADEILERVARCTLRYDRDECFDLPPRGYVEWRCDPTAEQRRLWDEIAVGARVELDALSADPVRAEQVGNRIAQVAGGFWHRDGAAARLAENPKLVLLDDQLDGLPDKVVIFHHYVEEGRMIGEWLAKRGQEFAECRGEVKHRPEQIARFTDDPRCRFLVANPQSGGVGLNLQVCPMAIFYSTGMTTAVGREQAEGRIYRLGQERPTTIVDLILRGSLDERRLCRTRDAVERAQEILAWVRDYAASR